MNFQTFQFLILVVLTAAYAVSHETATGRFRDSDSDFRDTNSDSRDIDSGQSDESHEAQNQFQKFWSFRNDRHSSREWLESHEPRRHHPQRSNEWHNSNESHDFKKHRKSHHSNKHEHDHRASIDSFELRKWEDLTHSSSSKWDKAPPWLACPSLTYHLQCEPGEKKNCRNDSDCGYSQKCCPIVGGGVMGRPMNCCRSYTRPSWWWPTESPPKPCPHHQTTRTPTYWTTSVGPWWWDPTYTIAAETSTAGATRPWWWNPTSPTTEEPSTERATWPWWWNPTSPTTEEPSTAGATSPWWWNPTTPYEWVTTGYPELSTDATREPTTTTSVTIRPRRGIHQ